MAYFELPKSRFLKVKCNDCGNEQVAFGYPAGEVKCLVCGKAMLQPSGGKAVVNTKIVKVLD